MKENYGLAVDDSRYVIHYQRLGAKACCREMAVFPIGDESARAGIKNNRERG